MNQRLMIAILAASSGLPGPPCVALAADGPAEDGRIEEATRLYLGGRYEEAEKRLAPLVVEHPEMPSLQRKLGLCYYYLRRFEPALANLRGYLARDNGITPQDREDVERWIRELSVKRPPPPPSSVVPSFQRGFLMLPYAGWQFPVHGPGWLTSGFRFGTLIGGHLSRHLSLAGEPAFATWGFCQGGGSDCYDPHRATQLDASATLLGHVHLSRAELIFGPRLGWSIVLRNNFYERTYMFINGLQMGAKAGLFVAASPLAALGVVLDLAYTRSYESDSRCFESFGFGELDCNETNNTAFGALSAAILF